MLNKLQAVVNKYEELCFKSEQPDFYADPKKAAKLLREKNDLEPVVDAYQAYRQTEQDMADAQELMADPEMKELCQETYAAAKAQKEELFEKLGIEDETEASTVSGWVMEKTEKIPQVGEDMVSSYVKIMTICAQYLTLSNAIPSTKPTVAELAKRYISENVHKKICITDICNELGCSKSTLLTTFKSKYGITVNTYITESKLDRSVHLLLEEDMTISEIAAETGFSDQSYFSKVFSAKYGVSPTDYRQSSAEIAKTNREEYKYEDNTYV